MTHPVPGRVRIASPCSADWSAMAGDERSRHCEACGLRVHNLAALTGAEISVLTGQNARVCVRLYRRADGTVLTADCPEGQRAVRAARVRKAWTAAALVALWAASERAVAGAWALIGGPPPTALVDGMDRLGTAVRDRLAPPAPPPDDMDWVMGETG